MKIKDIITITATLLGREKITEYLSSDKECQDLQVLSQVDTLTRLANLVLSELAGGYIPMYKEQVVRTTNGKIYYKDLDETLLEVVDVLDLCDSQVSYTQKEEYVQTDLSKAKIVYKYLPSNYDLDDTIGYSESQISACVLAYGVSAEFCLTEKNFDESVMWHDRFVKSVSQKLKPKNAQIKSRRFC